MINQILEYFETLFLCNNIAASAEVEGTTRL